MSRKNTLIVGLMIMTVMVRLIYIMDVHNHEVNNANIQIVTICVCQCN